MKDIIIRYTEFIIYACLNIILLIKSLHYEDIIDEFAVLQLNPEKLVFD